MSRPGFNDDATRMQAAVLRSIKADLDLLIRPELKSEEARTAAWLASEMLTCLAVASTSANEIHARLFERQRRILSDAAADANAVPVAGPGPQPDVASALDPDKTRARLAGELCDLLAGLLAGPRPSVQSRALIDTAWKAERDSLEAFDHCVRAELTLDADPVAAIETPVTVERLQAWFQQHPAGVDVTAVSRVERVPGGYSKDTWLIGLDGRVANHSLLVLRRDLPFGPGENTVLDEVDLLEHLFNAGLPVPEPLCSESNADWLGTPFVLFPCLGGQAVFGDWGAPSEERERLLLTLAEVMARLHSLDPAEASFIAGPQSPAAPSEVVRDYIRAWRDKWLRRRVHPSAILEVAFDWLLRHTPENLPAARFVHGDISLRNTLIREGRLEALLDWEFWHLGDPVEDLSYFRLIAEPYIPWERFMAAYRAAGGGDYDEARAKFYAVWRSVRNSTTTTTAWHGFLSGAYPASKAAYQGVSLYHFFLRDVATQLEAAGA